MCVCLKQPVEELDGTESLSLRESSFSLPIFELGHQSSAAFGLRLDLKPLSLLDLWLGNCTSLDLSAFMINVSQFLLCMYVSIYLSIYLPTYLPTDRPTYPIGCFSGELIVIQGSDGHKTIMHCIYYSFKVDLWI